MSGTSGHQLVSNSCWTVGYKPTAEVVSTWRVCILLYFPYSTGVVAVFCAHVEDMWTPGHLDMWCLATLAASWKRNIQKVMEWWWQFWNGACFRTFKLPWNVYRVSKADGHIYVRIWCIWYHSACSLSPHTQNATLTLHWAPILWMCWTDPRSNCNLQSWTKGRLKPAHMWSHDLPFAHESYEFMIE